MNRLLGVNLGQHSQGNGLGEHCAVGSVEVGCIGSSKFQVADYLSVALLSSFLRREVSWPNLFDIISSNGFCYFCNNWERTPQSCHIKHSYGTEQKAFSLPLATLCIAHLALRLEVVEAVDKHIRLCNVFQIAVPVAFEYRVSAINGICLERHTFSIRCSVVGIVCMCITY